MTKFLDGTVLMKTIKVMKCDFLQGRPDSAPQLAQDAANIDDTMSPMTADADPGDDKAVAPADADMRHRSIQVNARRPNNNKDGAHNKSEIPAKALTRHIPRTSSTREIKKEDDDGGVYPKWRIEDWQVWLAKGKSKRWADL